MAATVTESARTVTPERQRRRRQYWVSPRLQGRFVVWLVATTAVVATIVAWAILLVVWTPLGNRIVLSSGEMAADQLFWDACLRVLATTAFMVFIFGLVTFLVVLIITHRVAGPLYRIGLTAAQVAQGHYRERVNLRRKDYIQDFADKFNEMLDNVESRFRRQQRTIAETYGRLSDMEVALSGGMENSAEFAKKLQETLRALHEARVAELAESTPPE